MVMCIDIFIQAAMAVEIISRHSIIPCINYINHMLLGPTFDLPYYLVADNLISILEFIMLLKFVTIDFRLLNFMGIVFAIVKLFIDLAIQ